MEQHNKLDVFFLHVHYWKRCLCPIDTHLEGSCRRWQGASRSAGYSWGSGQRWRCRWDTRQTLLLRCNTAARHGLEENRGRTNPSDKMAHTKKGINNKKGRVMSYLDTVLKQGSYADGFPQLFHDFRPNFHDQTFCEILVYIHGKMRTFSI